MSDERDAYGAIFFKLCGTLGDAYSIPINQFLFYARHTHFEALLRAQMKAKVHGKNWRNVRVPKHARYSACKVAMEMMKTQLGIARHSMREAFKVEEDNFS